MDIIGNYCRRIKSWVNTLLTGGTVDADFNSCNIAVDEAYKQATKIILRIKDLNTYIGENTGKATTGNYNNFMGGYAGYSNTTGNYNNFMGGYAGYSNTTGHRNNFMGYVAGYSNTTGHRNNFMGGNAGYSNTTGHQNNFVGRYAGYSNTTGYLNNFVGCAAGYSNTTGYLNNFVGCAAGYSNTTGHRNNFMGGNAGYYETGSNKLFLDNQPRTNEADGKVKALIYGIFDAVTANQLVRLNAKKVEMPQLGNYADDATAATGGIAVGGLYHNAGNVRVRIV